MSTRIIPYLERTLDENVPELRQYLMAGAKVLDVGCGPGTITCGVAEVVQPGEVVGTDIKEERIRKATEFAVEGGINNATFTLMDAQSDETHSAMIADGFIDQETLKQATEEARAWYQDPRAFHFWAMVFAAGKA